MQTFAKPAIVLSTLLCAPVSSQEQGPHDLEPVRERLDEMVADRVAVGVVAMVERDGELLLEHAAGQLAQGGDPMQLDSIVRIFSMTKPVTAVAALTLIEEGAFELDDPVGEYLPALAELRVVDPRDKDETVACERPMLVRDLFQHTTSWSYETPWRAVAAGNFEFDPDLDAMVRALAELPLTNQPGSKWIYGISNDVLGALIEVVAEQPLDDVFRERIFVPLGMHDTDFHVAREKLERLATLHYVDGRGVHAVPGWNRNDAAREPTLLEGGAGLYSTAGDYMRFARMLLGRGQLDGMRILEPESVELMTTNQIGDIPRDETLGERDWGLGIAITTSDFDSGSTGTWTWGGAAGTTFWVDPSTETTAVFLVQNWMDFGPAAGFDAAVAEALATPQSTQSTPRNDDERPDVLFYLIDTCRADHLSYHGHEAPTTPFLDQLAERSVVFERCYSQAPWTKPSMASILSSTYPSEHGIQSLLQRLPSSVVTLPEMVEDAGWTTAGFSANPLMGALSNYTQGFGHFTESIRVNRADPIRFASGSAAKLNREVFGWLERNPAAPTFLYVHSVDPHEEYEPAPEHLERFADPAGMDTYREQWQALLDTRPDVPGNHLTQWNFDQADIEPGPFIAYGEDLYDADISANDVQIERLWERLMADGWGEDTIVIVTSDHGEEFFEHGGTSHGYSLYEELIHVPLMIHAPGLLPEGLRVDRPVRSIDIYPTLLELLDIEAPPGLRGRSLVPLASGASDWEDVPIFSEGAEDPMGRAAGSGMGTTTAMIDGDWKLLINYVDPPHRARPAHELYNLAKDPAERVNLAQRQGVRLARMQEQVAHWSAANMGLRMSAESIDTDALDPAVAAELEALGYLSGDAESDLPEIGDALPVHARAILEADTRLSLYALSPERPVPAGTRESELLHSWRILDDASVRDEERDEVLTLLYRGIALSDGSMARCFEPRHAIRAMHRGHTVDLLICFECAQLQVWMNDARLTTVPVNADIEPAFSRAFREQGLRIDGDE